MIKLRYLSPILNFPDDITEPLPITYVDSSEHQGMKYDHNLTIEIEKAIKQLGESIASERKNKNEKY